MRVVADFDESLSLEEMLADIGLALIQYNVERPNATKLFMREAATATPETLTIIGPMAGKVCKI